MAKRIEMNYKESEEYEILYPQTLSNISLNSPELNSIFSLSSGSVVDDAFEYLNRKMILIQYGKAGVNVTLKTQGGNPLEGFTINGITLNYDGTGSCITNSEGKCFGYCNAGNITIGVNNYTDITFNNQSITAVASEIYDINLIGSNLTNFKKYTNSTSNISFSPNVQQVDVSVGGAGCGGGSGGTQGGDGGGGGYSVIKNNFNFDNITKYSVMIGAGGRFDGQGGSSSFGDVSANGANLNSSNGNGGSGGRYGGNAGDGGNGTTYIYTSFTSQSLYGGGGGGGAYSLNYSAGNGGSPGGGAGARNGSGEDGKNGLGGGGGGNARQFYDTYSKGGSGVVCIRMYLKVTS